MDSADARQYEIVRKLIGGDRYDANIAHLAFMDRLLKQAQAETAGLPGCPG